MNPAPKYGPKTEHERRQAYIKRHADLKSQRSTFDSAWREIATYVKPRRSRFFAGDRANAGQKKEFNIINNSPSRAVDINAAGMQAGITSPTRPWFRLTTSNKDLAEVDSVKGWLGHTEDRMRQVFSGSNLYQKLHELYLDLGPFGTSVLHIEEHTKQVICAWVFPVGSYVLSNGADGRVDTVMRSLQMNVAQLVEEFTYEKCSRRVRDAYDRNQLDEWIELLHVVEPNRQHMPGKLGLSGKAYLSTWLEVGAGEADGFLREAGFHECPFIAPRWSTTGEDAYGNGPGQESIGDCKTLQLLEREALRLTEKTSNPPTVGPSSMRQEPIDLNPGGVNYEDPADTGKGFRPLYVPPPQAIAAVQDQLGKVQMRIEKTFKVDVWLMLSQVEDGQKTATEVLELKAEKMLQMGPMLERFQNEALRILIERVFGIMLRNRLVPPPPPEIQGQDLTIEYESTLAQAQKMSGIQGVKELASFAASLATANPDALDNINEDKMIEQYAEMIGTNPDLLRSADERDAMRQQRAQARAQQAQQQQQMMAAQGAKTLSQADTEGDNALTRLMNASGVASA